MGNRLRLEICVEDVIEWRAMGLLFKAALQNRKHMVLLVVTMLSMCCYSMASLLEIFALGVVAKSGPEFFELFAPMQNDKLKIEPVITQEDLLRRWQQLDPEGKGFVTPVEASSFLDQHRANPDRLGQAINYVDAKFNVRGSIVNLVIFMIIVALFKAISQFSHRFTTRLVAIRVSRDMRQNYFEHIQSLPMDFYQKHNIGSLSTRACADANVIADALTSTLINYFQSPFIILATLGACFFTSWKLTLLIFLGFPLLITPIILITKQVKKIGRQIQKSQEKFASILIDFFSGIQTVKVFAMEDYSLQKYREHNHHMAKLEQKGARYDLSSRPIVHTVGIFCLVSVMLYGLYVLQMSLTELLVYCGLLNQFYEPIKKFAEENNQIQRGVIAAERMYEVLKMSPNIQDKPDAVELGGLRDSIVFENVWFGYGEDKILKGVSFTVKKGQTVALVGPTGAGKSTIVQLLPRLYDIQEGKILIDGVSLADYTQKSLRENIAFVPQKPFLFMDTIHQNIAFGRPFTRVEVEEAAKKAFADEFVKDLAEGYDSFLAEAGKNLSGGQQQRLAIARALVKKAPILVLDEATSSLDNISENRIKHALQNLHGQVTQIIIAHRLTTIESADKIIYLEHGRKIAEGTKEELLQSCLGFRAMWEAMHQPRQEPQLAL